MEYRNMFKDLWVALPATLGCVRLTLAVHWEIPVQLWLLFRVLPIKCRIMFRDLAIVLPSFLGCVHLTLAAHLGVVPYFG